jgi:hypothetical protein
MKNNVMDIFLKTTIKLCIMVVLFGIGIRLSAQDMIVFSNGSIEQVKILEVGDDVIKYKKMTNLDGPIFSTSRANVFTIKYQDGTEEKISSQSQRAVRQGRGYPQTQDGGFSIHFGGAFPVGNFGNEVGLVFDPHYWRMVPNFDNGFSAGPGFNIGIKGKIPLTVNGLGIFISGDFIYNGVKGTLKNDYDDEQAKIERDGGSFTRSRYINVPILMGINYKYRVNQNFGIWVEGGLGTNFRKITATKIDYGNYTETAKAPVRICFAGQVGAGIMVNDLFSIGLHYYGLGSAKLEIKYENDRGYSWTDTTARSYSQGCFMVRLGFHF